MKTLISEKAKVIRESLNNALRGVRDEYTSWLEKKGIITSFSGEVKVTGIGQIIIDKYFEHKDVRKMWRIEPHPNNFVRHKSKDGISSYTFYEACMYRGYIDAFCQAYGFACSDSKYTDCKLVQDFMDIHYDTVKFWVKVEGSKPVTFFVARSGQILDENGEESDLHFREWEATILARMERKHKKTLKKMIANDQFTGLPKLTPEGDQGTVKEGE